MIAVPTGSLTLAASARSESGSADEDAPASELASGMGPAASTASVITAPTPRERTLIRQPRRLDRPPATLVASSPHLTIVPIPFRVLMAASSRASPASAAHGRRRGNVFPW